MISFILAKNIFWHHELISSLVNGACLYQLFILLILLIAAIDIKFCYCNSFFGLQIAVVVYQFKYFNLMGF